MSNNVIPFALSTHPLCKPLSDLERLMRRAKRECKDHPLTIRMTKSAKQLHDCCWHRRVSDLAALGVRYFDFDVLVGDCVHLAAEYKRHGYSRRAKQFAMLAIELKAEMLRANVSEFEGPVRSNG